VVSDYVKKQGKLTLAKNGSGKSWSFVKATTAGPVILRSAPGKLAIASNSGLSLVKSEGALDANGFAKYAIDLSK
jgi:2',3'-cyclic-nucleotide 2'-phosphodiesterase/3'-nucleotidase